MKKNGKPVPAITCVIFLAAIIFAVFAWNLEGNVSSEEKAISLQNKGQKQITLYLINGETRTGFFVSHNRTTITIKTEMGTQTIQKEFIVKTDPPWEEFLKMINPAKKRIRPGRDLRIPDSNRSFSARLVLFAAANLIGPVGTVDTQYEDPWETEFVTVTEDGLIAPDPISGYGCTIGMAFYFFKNFGIAASFTLNLNKKVDIVSEYDFGLTWFDNDVDGWGKSWTSPGDVTVTPLTVNLIYSPSLSRNLALSVYGGLAIFFTSVDLTSHFGWGYVYPYETPATTYYIPDWWDFEHRIEAQDNLVGGNIGIDLEFRLNSTLGIFIGGQYFFGPTVEYVWQPVEKNRYDGELDNLWTEELPDLMELTTEITYSFYSIYLGFKIHLNFGGR